MIPNTYVFSLPDGRCITVEADSVQDAIYVMEDRWLSLDEHVPFTINRVTGSSKRSPNANDTPT